MDYLLISSVYHLLETYFLICLRIFGFFVVMPVFGGQTTNAMVKISISLTTAFIIMTSQIVTPVAVSQNIGAFFALGIKEVFVGIIMGYSVYFLLALFYYVGQLADFQIGFSMVSVFDPVNQIQIPITGNLFYLCVSFLLVLTGAHYNLFRALFYSYKILPIGESVLTSETMLNKIISMFGAFFEIGFRISLPIVGTMLVIELALGILNKAAPQMHIFSIGMSVKILIGLSLMYIMLPMFNLIAEEVLVYINRTLYTVIGGMAPNE